MARKVTVDVINEIMETRNDLNKLIIRLKNLEDALKGLPSRNYVSNMIRYLQTIKDKYLKRFEEEMVKLRQKTQEEIKRRQQMIQKLQKI